MAPTASIASSWSPRKWSDAFFVAGTPDEARRLLAQYEGTADSVILSPPSYFLSHEEVEDYQDAILETFAPVGLFRT